MQDTTNPKVLEAVPIFQGKVDAVKYLQSVVSKNPAISWTAVINGPFFDWVRNTQTFFHYDTVEYVY